MRFMTPWHVPTKSSLSPKSLRKVTNTVPRLTIRREPATARARPAQLSPAAASRAWRRGSRRTRARTRRRLRTPRRPAGPGSLERLTQLPQIGVEALPRELDAVQNVGEQRHRRPAHAERREHRPAHLRAGARE